MREEKMKNTVHARRAIAYTVLIIISFLCLFWFYVLFINATRSNGELGKGFTVVPSTHLIENLTNLFKGTLPVLRGMLNSLIIASLSAACCTYFSTMTAYSIHAYDYAGRKAIFTFILTIMMIPTQVTALGFVKLVQSLNLENNYIPLIIPSIAAPVTFFYLKQYMDSNLPGELIEAARIDGAGELRIFNTVALPLMRPAIAVQAIFTFVTTWNNFFVPALVISDNSKKTMPILIAALRSADFMKFDMGKVYMIILIAILPIIIVYLILSRYIIAGVTLGGVKE